MKKAGKVLLIIGVIFSILCVIGFVAGGIVFSVFTNPEYKNAIVQGLQDGTITSSFPGTVEEQAANIQAETFPFLI